LIPICACSLSLTMTRALNFGGRSNPDSPRYRRAA
jgi:hypothetical protein